MRVFIGSDHQGFQFKKKLIESLKKDGYEVVDKGAETIDPDDDYPIYVKKVVLALQGSDEDNDKGILICGSGHGMCIAANRFKGVRAILGYSKDSVYEGRNDDDANILCLAAHNYRTGTYSDIVETFLKTEFAAAPRYIRRIREMDEA